LETKIKNEFLEATFNTKGAELVSLKSRNKEYIWNGNPEFWGKHSPILFPIVGTLKNNSYLYNNTEYSLSRHGFARDFEFERIEKQDDSLMFILKSSEKTLKLFPFEFQLKLTYQLHLKKIFFRYEIINNNDFEMPFSIGAHPAFSLQNSFSEYNLEFEFQEDLCCYALENNLLSDKTKTITLIEKKLNLDYKLFENDALVIKKLQSKQITINKKEIPLLKVTFNNFPNLGIWTTKNAPFVCIEPWLGYSDTQHSSGKISEKEGIQKIMPNGTYNCEFNVEIL
jgi:galactose mutarotase-like enzyme